jgi:hypothetical protein
MVDPPADLPDLAVGPRERRDVAHVNHRLRKVLEEDVLVCGVELDELGGGGAVGEENVVGGEQAAVREQVLVVLVVELEGGHGVQEEEVLVAAGARATLAQRRRVGRVQLVVREAVAGLVVQALAGSWCTASRRWCGYLSVVVGVAQHYYNAYISGLVCLCGRDSTSNCNSKCSW